MTKPNKKTRGNAENSVTGRSHKLNVRVNKSKVKAKSFEERVISEDEFISGFDDKVEHYVENYVDKVERTKKLTLISGVSFFMLLIVFFYAFSFKTQITSLADSGDSSLELESQLDSLKNNISNVVDEYKEIKEIVSQEINISSSSNDLPENLDRETSLREVEIDQEKIENLKEMLIKEENK